MSLLSAAGPAEATAESVREQLERILASPGFAHSQRLCRFLRFVVERTLAGHGDELKEYLLGIEVFDRKSSYDPRLEPIVRVEARRLRSKLKKYYQTDGRRDALRIELPTGSYLPVFAGPEAAARPASSAEPAIAVLPFANLSADPVNEYFSDGLTEELIHVLTRVEGLRVVSSASAFFLKRQGHDIRRIGEQLNVATVLEGSVRSSGDRLRVTAQLVSTGDGAYLWSETYERKIEDVFAIQDEISRAIVDTLRIRLAPQARLVKCHTHNLKAYHLYLQGRHHWNRQTGEGLAKAIEYFGQAIAEDARYASAYAGLSDSYNLLVVWGAVAPVEVRDKANAAARLAVEIDDTLAEAHTSLAANRAVLDWDFAGAERSFRRAIELNPRFASARHGYAMLCLSPLGRVEEAVVQMRQAQELDPLSLFINTSLGTALYYARRYDQAIEQFQKTLDLDPNYHLGWWGLGRAHVRKGAYEEAATALSRARELASSSPVTISGLGYCQALAGRPQAAHSLLEELRQRARRSYVSPFHAALIHLGLGDIEQVFEWLGKACQERDAPLAWLRVDPAYDPLRADPRFAALLENLTAAQGSSDLR